MKKNEEKAIFVFPNQIFEHPLFLDRRKTQLTEAQEKDQHIYLLEEPLFFYDKDERPYKTHKLKIVFLRAALKSYHAFLEDKGMKNVNYCDYNDLDSKNKIKNVMKKYQRVQFYDPYDFDVIKKYKEIGKDVKVEIEIEIDSPMFILSKDEKDTYYQKNDKGKTKRIQHSHFFDYAKTKMKVLEKVSSTDQENRNSLPSDFELKDYFKKDNCHESSVKQSKQSKQLKQSKDIMDEAIHYVKNHKQFKSHYGHLDILSESNKSNELKESICYPITFAEAKAYFETFLKNRFEFYGKYQDAVHTDYIILFHGHLSHLLNCGLLTPHYVLEKVMDFQKSHNKIPLNSVEGFVRQLLGWREYMHYIYVYHFDHIMDSNIFKMDRSIINKKEWYEGTLGIEPIDHEIKKVLKTGYAHHIIRLMFIMNFMILCHIKKEDIIQWFMEMVALDAYPWVMYSNIAAMGLFTDKFMRKPYLTTSNYILNMSNYKKDNKNANNDSKKRSKDLNRDLNRESKGSKDSESWTEIWDSLFYYFLKKKEDLVKKHAGIYTRNLAYYNKKSNSEQNKIDKVAHDFIQKMTRL